MEAEAGGERTLCEEDGESGLRRLAPEVPVGQEAAGGPLWNGAGTGVRGNG